MENNYEKRGYLLEDFRLFHLRDAQGPKVEHHYHEFHKIVLLVSGSGGYVVEGRRYLLKPGDVVMVGSRCVHRPEFESGSPYGRIIIYISPEFLQSHSTADCDLEEYFYGRAGHVLRPDERGQKQLLEIARELERELAGSHYGRVIVSNGLLLRLLVAIGRGFLQPTASRPEPTQPKDGKILDILRYIDNHLAEDITIDMLAERFYISKFHMMRRFREETGSSVHTYLSDRRLMLARDMIRNGIPATDACFQCGFRSYSSFSRAYGKLFGTTPTGRTGAAAPEESTYE